MKYYVTLLLALVCTFLSGQTTYSFEQDSEVYTPLENGTIISEQDWLDFDTLLSLPFEINLFGTSVDELLVGEGALLYEDASEDILTALSIFGADYQSSVLLPDDTQVIYEVNGSVGSRVLTIEWRSLYFEYLDGFFDFVNFQFRYFESNGRVEFHYGPSETDLIDVAYTERNQDFGSIIGLGIGTVTTLENGIFLDGAPGNLTIIRDTLGFHATFPSTDVIYRFSPMVTSINNLGTEQQPCLVIKEHDNDQIITEQKVHGPIHLISTAGQRVLTSLNDQVSLSDLKNGIYFLVAPECGESKPIIIAR